MALLSIELEWCRDSRGYELIEVPGYGKWIVGKGGTPVWYKPFEIGDAALLAFSNANSEEKLLRFASHYGYLTEKGYSESGRVRTPRRVVVDRYLEPKADVPTLIGESVDQHLAAVALFKKILAGDRSVKSSRSTGLTDLLDAHAADGSFVLKVDAKGNFRPILRPNSLMYGLLVRLAQMADGSAFKLCQLPRCGQLFAVGVGTGLRADAKFCSPQHRIEYHSRNRTTGAHLSSVRTKPYTSG